MTYERRVAQDRSLTDRHMPMSAALALVCVCVCVQVSVIVGLQLLHYAGKYMEKHSGDLYPAL